MLLILQLKSCVVVVAVDVEVVVVVVVEVVELRASVFQICCESRCRRSTPSLSPSSRSSRGCNHWCDLQEGRKKNFKLDLLIP